jgi:hypothetical protein
MSDQKQPLPYYRESVKKAIYKLRENNAETFKEYSNKWANENYKENSEKYKEYARKKYWREQYSSYDRIAKVFRKILL